MTRARDVANVLSTATALSTDVETAAAISTAIDAIPTGMIYSADEPVNPEIGQVWIDTNETTQLYDPNIIRRTTITSTQGQTVYSAQLPFVDGYEQVFLNGVLLQKTVDYSTSNNTTVTLNIAANVGDLVEILSISNLNSISTYTTTEVDAKLAQKATIGVGTTANRPVSASIGDLYYDTTIGQLMAYGASGWVISGTSGLNLPIVTGGTLSSDSTYYYRTFSSNGTLSVSNTSLNADVLVVAGGGGGGVDNYFDRQAGGGGAGGVIYFANQSLSPNLYIATIGAGGVGGNGGSSIPAVDTNGKNGNNSQFANLTVAVGGGYGGGHTGTGAGSGALPGGDGGSGGGGSTAAGGNSTQTSTGATSIYGNPGGALANGSWGGYGGGGGGAGARGSITTVTSVGGDGTNAFSTWHAGSSTGVNGYIAGGGAGWGYNAKAVSGGAGGGGSSGSGGSSSTPSTYGTNGTANTGGGGGASHYTPAGNGGSGLIIIRYLKTAVAA